MNRSSHRLLTVACFVLAVLAGLFIATVGPDIWDAYIEALPSYAR